MFDRRFIGDTNTHSRTRTLFSRNFPVTRRNYMSFFLLYTDKKNDCQDSALDANPSTKAQGPK